MLIDLHAHTNCSDGTDTPQQLLYSAQKAGLTVVGITDHDTIAGWQEAAAQVNSSGVSLVRGMEISTRWENISVHLLGFLFNPEFPELRLHQEKLRTSRQERAQKMVEKIALDYPITWEEVVEEGERSCSLGRPHIADVLVKKGYVPDRSVAFATILHPSGKYYLPQYAPSTLEAIEWVVKAGGKAVLAHPRAPKRGQMISDSAFSVFRDAGLFGVEVAHRDNLPELRDSLAKLVSELGLAALGASDYHGWGKPNRLGENCTSPAVFSALCADTYLPVLHPEMK